MTPVRIPYPVPEFTLLKGYRLMVKFEKILTRMNHSLEGLLCSKRVTKQNLIISTIRRLEGWLIMICKVCKLKEEVNTKRFFNLIEQA